MEEFDKWFLNQDHDKFNKIYNKIKNKYWIHRLYKNETNVDPVNWKYNIDNPGGKNNNYYTMPTYEEMMLRQYLFEIKQLPLTINR